MPDRRGANARATDTTRDRSRVGEPGRDSGAFIGRMPERSTETIPGGIGRKDQRVSAVASQPGPRSPESDPPEGHREGATATDANVREAGQNR